jgi:HRDC domain
VLPPAPADDRHRPRAHHGHPRPGHHLTGRREIAAARKAPGGPKPPLHVVTRGLSAGDLEHDFHDATLRQIAADSPASLADLGRISGIGEAKLARYGAQIIELLAGQPAG